jgi:Integrase
MHARIGWQNLRTSEFLDNGDYMLITGTDFQDGAINYSTCHYVERERYIQDRHIQINNGSILITKDGTLGKVAYVQGLKMPATLNAGVFNVELRDENAVDGKYLFQYLKAPYLMDYVSKKATGGTIKHLNQNILVDFPVVLPNYEEQSKIGEFFFDLDNLITLHQRKPFCPKEEEIMQNQMNNQMNNQSKFCDYYAKWIDVYKKGAVRKVTMSKYLMTHKWITKLIPNLRIEELDRIMYQQLLNEYAECHEKQTVMDFHHHLKGAILDAVDEGLIDRDPTRKAIIKGKVPRVKKVKYLNQFQLQTLISSLHLKEKISWDYLILLVAKTGMRFSEALALTPDDFDLRNQTIIVCKTWDYKGNGGFMPTKNRSSNRKIQIDWQTVIRFSELIKNLPQDQPIFVDGKVYNSTINDILGRMCKKNNLPIISVHGLRHTHASLLLFTGVSTASVARRLGHSSINTTQRTYLHIIQELENKDVDLVMRSLAAL